MENKIDNNSLFNFYICFKTFINIIAVINCIVFLLYIINYLVFKWALSFLIIFALFYITLWFILMFIEQLIKPAYFEALISSDKITIKTFSTTKFQGFKFAFLKYKNYLVEYTIDKDSFDNYKITVGRFGLGKQIVLLKGENDLIKQSEPISISFIDTKRFNDFILSVDRLVEKINLK